MQDTEIPDERLALVFTCCHPALAASARTALTLQAVAGLSVTEIARAFLLREATVAQRLVRAKRKIREAGIPFGVPGPELWTERLGGVLEVLYLVFNEGLALALEWRPCARICARRLCAWCGWCSSCSHRKRRRRACSP